MAWTYALIATVIGLIALAIAVLAVRQRQARMTISWIGAIVGAIGIIGLIAPQATPFLQGEIGFTEDLGTLAASGTANLQGASPQPTVTVCDQSNPTTVTLSAEDVYTAATTGGTHRYRINGAPALTVADAGTFTASPGDRIDVLWNNASRTGYYGKVSTYVVPCLGTKTFSEKLSQNGSLTTRIFNEEGNLIDNVNENETLAAGDVVNLKYELQGQFQRDYAHGFTLVLEYNSSSIDSIKLQDANGAEFPSVTTPQVYVTAYGTSSATKSYLLPKLTSNTILAGTIVIDADDTNNPGAGRDGDINMTYLPHNFFINEDVGGKFDGPAAEDEDNVATRAGAFEFFQLNID